MAGEHISRAAERAWKHRFAQTLYEFFRMGGQDPAAAIDDAYAHADAQYLVRGVRTPEEEARTALVWITADSERPYRSMTVVPKQDRSAANANNGAHHAGAQSDIEPED